MTESVGDSKVDLMSRDGAPTAPLDEFLAAYEQDDNHWWVIACGHHQNLFEAASDRMQAAEAKLASIETLCDGAISRMVETARVRAILDGP